MHGSNPFVECGVASHAINTATVKRQRDHAALARLQKKIGELALEVTICYNETVNIWSLKESLRYVSRKAILYHSRGIHGCGISCPIF